MNDVKRVILKNNSSANTGPDSSVTGSSGEKICVGYWALIPQTSR